MRNLKVNTALNMIKTGANIVFPLITIPYVLRVLSANNIGKVDFGNSFVSYFSLIASLGISTYAIRECAKVRDDRKKHVARTNQAHGEHAQQRHPDRQRTP